LVSAGVSPGEKIVVSPLSAAVDGMLLRLPGEKSAPKGEPQAADPKTPAKSSSAPPAKPKAASAGVTESKAGQSL
jgi:hypothetical protein